MRRGMKLFGVASAVVLVLAAAGYSSTRGASPSGAVSARSATAVPAWLKKARKNALQAQKITTHVVSRAYGKFTPKPNATIFHIACNLAFEGCSKLANGIKAGVEAARLQVRPVRRRCDRRHNRILFQQRNPTRSRMQSSSTASHRQESRSSGRLPATTRVLRAWRRRLQAMSA